jgi:hypothetical protein
MKERNEMHHIRHQHHGNWRLRLSVGAIFCALCLTALPVQAGTTLTQALREGKPHLTFMPSFEYKDVDGNGSDAATQFSVRTRVGYETGSFYGASAFIQLQNITNLNEDFRHPEGGDADNDFIADPDGSRVHQAYLDYKYEGLPDSKLRLGRQEIILDDARLIGNIDWRLNGQSFDAATATIANLPNFELFAGYINQVNTINRDYVDLDGLYLAHGSYTGLPGQELSAFVYLLDTESEANTARDSATYGLRWQGKWQQLSYYADGAYQSDFTDGEDHDAFMINVYADYSVKPVTLGIGYSLISGQDGDDRPFDTLFSTAHKFNGYADVFAGTNGGNLKGGLEDYYAEAKAKLWGTSFLLASHWFEAEASSEAGVFDGTYGYEVDAVVARKIAENTKVLVKFAQYWDDDERANGVANPTTDTLVITTRLIYSF